MGPPILNERTRDLALATALTAGALAQLALIHAAISVLEYSWIIATTLPLALRHRWPLLAGLGVQVAFVAGTPSSTVNQELLAQGVSVYLVATYVAALGAKTWWGSCACGMASLVLLGIQGVLDTQYGTTGAVLANSIYVSMSWAVAAAVRTQVDRSQRSVTWAQTTVLASEEQARTAALHERERLARELHDVLGHSISAMVLRARGGVHDHHVDPQRGLDALRDIEASGARALADVRTLLELDLTHDQHQEPEPRENLDSHSRHPLPGLGDLDELIENTRRSGMAIEHGVHGVPRRVSDGLGLTVYRLVQEALTNTMRHSGSPEAQVMLTWADNYVTVSVADHGPANDSGTGGGRGLIGLGERVAVLGGELQSGPRPSGGFEVRARIPVCD